MNTKVETITPALAQSYLGLSRGNRRIRKMWVGQLAEMIRSGDWHLTHQGIAFNGDGSLKDGHHRLMAIVEADVAVPVLVARGLSAEAVSVIDTHARRNDADAMKLDGIDVDHHDVAIGRRMMESVGSNFDCAFTRPAVRRFVIEHFEAIRFARSGAKTEASFCHASIRAPVARAWYSRDRDRLSEFIACVRSGVMNSSGDVAAITFRNYLLRVRGSAGSGSVARSLLYRKVESALSAFLESRPYSKVYECSKELFLLPGEGR